MQQLVDSNLLSHVHDYLYESNGSESQSEQLILQIAILTQVFRTLPEEQLVFLRNYGTDVLEQ